MNEQVQEWINSGVLKKWEQVKAASDPDIPTLSFSLSAGLSAEFYTSKRRNALSAENAISDNKRGN